jgi:hypothetical protein
MLVVLAVVGCQKEPTPAPTPTDQTPIPTAANYVGSDTCKNCHKESHAGFTQSQHYNTFKPLSEYSIADLPKEITVFDTAAKENPKSTTIDLSTTSGVMVDHYVVAQVPATAGFTGELYRVAAVHKEGDNWELEPARTGDFNNDGTEDWGAASYSCGNCHSPGLGVSDKESTIGCESCHGPGGSHITAEEKAGTMKVSQDACMACHPSYPSKNADGVWEANNHYGTRNYFASKHAASDQTNNCLACHTPHKVNSSGKTVVGDNIVQDNCSKCHQGVNINLDSLMWVNPSDARDHFVKDHSFGAMPYEDYGDDKETKPLEITNPDLVTIIEDNVPQD